MLQATLIQKMSNWGAIPSAPADPILGINAAFMADKSSNKHNLSIGCYFDDAGKQITLRSVREAERILVDTEPHKGYLSQSGDMEYTEQAAKLVFNSKLGEENETKQEKEFLKTVASIQTLSGTGAVRFATDFLARLVVQPVDLDNPFTAVDHKQKKPCYVSISDPTWGNHFALVDAQAGILRSTKYRYYDPSTKSFNCDWMLEDLEKLSQKVPSGHPAAVIMHVCCHNPTGCDPNMEQWKRIGDFFMANKNFVPIFDMAYQGFATGDPIAEAEPVHYFAKTLKMKRMMVCQSFSKNMGLYGERTGVLHVTCGSEEEKKRLITNFDVIARIFYSSPPRHGAEIVKKVLKTPKLRNMWTEDLKQMTGRINKMRAELRRHLEEMETPGDWSHITNQQGMFSYTGLNVKQVLALKANNHIYMTENGRINICGLNTKNVKVIAEAINKVVKEV